ncbi:MAG: hypothetical protein LDL14_09105 [Nitrospira sp.]|nr:hypothetical protein [Nitrospira sp.]
MIVMKKEGSGAWRQAPARRSAQLSLPFAIPSPVTTASFLLNEEKPWETYRLSLSRGTEVGHAMFPL